MEELTLEIAKKLKGKKIRVVAKGYAGQDTDKIITVGDFATQFDGFCEEAKIESSDSKKNKAKNIIQMLDSEGNNTFITADLNEFNSYNKWAKEEGKSLRDECCMTLGDSDRFVYFENA